MLDTHLTECYKKIITEQRDITDRIYNVELKTSINMFLVLLVGVVLFVMYITEIFKSHLTT